MSTIARHDGWRGSGCSLAGTTLALGESKTLKQRRCAACGGMHVDGERSSPKHGSNLAGNALPRRKLLGIRPSEMDRHQTEPVPTDLPLMPLWKNNLSSFPRRRSSASGDAGS